MPNVFIFGSCVARDTMPFLGEEWSMVGYVARQSWISGVSGRANVVGVSTLESPFQERCLQQDIAGSIVGTLREMADSIDIVVFDLTDERGGIYRAPGGGYITQTMELSTSTLLSQQPEPLTYIPFGTDEHFRLWAQAARKIVRLAQSLDLPSITLAPAWSTRLEGGGNPPFDPMASRETNELYVRYLDHLDSLGVSVVRIPEDEVMTSPDHQWGAAPYHYSDSVYVRLAQAIRDAVAPR